RPVSIASANPTRFGPIRRLCQGTRSDQRPCLQPNPPRLHSRWHRLRTGPLAFLPDTRRLSLAAPDTPIAPGAIKAAPAAGEAGSPLIAYRLRSSTTTDLEPTVTWPPTSGCRAG